MTKRDQNGHFISQGPNDGFDEKEGKEAAEEHSWQNHRKQNLKRLGLWEELEDE